MAERERDFELSSISSIVEDGDVVQITNEKHHWFPALLVVASIKSWGVQAYTVCVNNDNNEPNGLAYIRLNHDEYEKVGVAKIIVPD